MSAVGQVRPTTRTGVISPNRRPLGVPDSPTRPPLRVVPPGQIRLRARRRRAKVLMTAVGLVIALGMFVIVGAQVVLTQRQLRLDTMEQQLSKVQASNDQLQLSVAKLESPSHIVSEAESQLHMLAPTSVVYLTPGANPITPKVTGVPATPPQAGTPSTSSTSASSTSSGVPG